MIRTRSFRLATLAAAAALTLAACGGDDAATTDTTGSNSSDTSPSTAEPTDTTDTIDTTGSSSSGTTESAPSAEGGTCAVEVTGDAEASWTAGGGMSAVNTDYWLTPEMKDMFDDGFYFIVNCQGDGMNYFGLLAGQAASTDTVPYGPASYVLTRADTRFGTAGEDSPLSVMLTLDGDESVWGVSEPGTVEITAFDDEHVAGTVSFTAMDTLADLAGTPERTIQVSVSFDFDNPN